MREIRVRIGIVGTLKKEDETEVLEKVYRIYIAPNRVWGEEIGGDEKLPPSKARELLREGVLLAEDSATCKVVPAVKLPGKAPRPIRKLPNANAVVVGDQIIPMQIYKQYYSQYETEMYLPSSE